MAKSPIFIIIINIVEGKKTDKMKNCFLRIINLSLILVFTSNYLLSQKSIENNQQNITRLDSIYHVSLQNSDTTNAIIALTDLGHIYSHRAKYALSYEHFWNALSMAGSINDSLLLARIYNEIGWLYSYYKRSDEALQYYNQSLV